MTHLRIASAALIAVLATPAAALAQNASTINLTASVDRQCALGAPAQTLLQLNRITGANGRLDPAKTGDTTLVSTEIDIAWCNTPSTLTLQAAPLSLVAAPSYGSPAGFSRDITYDAVLTGWPTDATLRPRTGATYKHEIQAEQAHAGALTLTISRLGTLDDTTGAEAADHYVEAGSYTGEIILTLATAP